MSRVAKPSLLALLFITAAGCVTVTPPAPPKPRDATPVTASFSKTWNATIDEFAASNIPIRNIDRSSGFITTDPLTVGGSLNYADCGSVVGTPYRPDRATYNVVVRGDSSSSTIRTTVRFTSGGGSERYAPTFKECSSTGYWEKGFEERIKARAEKPAP